MKSHWSINGNRHVNPHFAPNFWGYLADSTGKRIELVRLGSYGGGVLGGNLFVGSHFWLMVAVLFAHSFFQNAILAQFEAVTIGHLQEQRALYGQIVYGDH